MKGASETADMKPTEPAIAGTGSAPEYGSKTAISG